MGVYFIINFKYKEINDISYDIKLAIEDAQDNKKYTGIEVENTKQ
jgi:hypothetical protein